jgi:hypothetical protein
MLMSQDACISTVTGYRLHDQGSYPRKSKGLFLFGVKIKLGQGLIQRILGSVLQLK